jgi:hypothetical protein
MHSRYMKVSAVKVRRLFELYCVILNVTVVTRPPVIFFLPYASMKWEGQITRHNLINPDADVTLQPEIYQ